MTKGAYQKRGSYDSPAELGKCLCTRGFATLEAKLEKSGMARVELVISREKE